MINIELALEYQIWEAALKDDTRQVMQGIYINSKGYMIASDGYILACVPCNIRVDSDNFSSVIIPSDIFKSSKVNQVIRIDQDNDIVHLYKGDRYTVSNLIKGKYPDWKQLIPEYKDFVGTQYITLNPSFYTRLGKAIGISKSGIQLMLGTSTKALFSKGYNGAWGMIMPMFTSPLTEEEFNKLVDI